MSLVLYTHSKSSHPSRHTNASALVVPRPRLSFFPFHFSSVSPASASPVYTFTPPSCPERDASRLVFIASQLLFSSNVLTPRSCIAYHHPLVNLRRPANLFFYRPHRLTRLRVNLPIAVASFTTTRREIMSSPNPSSPPTSAQPQSQLQAQAQAQAQPQLQPQLQIHPLPQSAPSTSSVHDVTDTTSTIANSSSINPVSPSPSTTPSVASPQAPVSSTSTLNVSAVSDPSARKGRPRGHRHSEESRRKIGLANRGNVPWNKGRPHSEETKRKIAESTRRAMLRPELRQLLKLRARNRRHSEQTKLKIRRSSRLSRGNKTNTQTKQRKTPVPFQFDSDTIKNINGSIDQQIEDVTTAQVGRETIATKPGMAEESKEKISRRIKELWNDPEYRAKVASGVEARMRRLREQGLAPAKRQKKRTRTSAGVSASNTPFSNPDGSNVASENSLPQDNNSFQRDVKSEVVLMDEDLEADEGVRGDEEEEEHSHRQDVTFTSEELRGWTKEDLGIFGSHGEGLIPGFGYDGMGLPTNSASSLFNTSAPQSKNSIDFTPSLLDPSNSQNLSASMGESDLDLQDFVRGNFGFHESPTGVVHNLSEMLESFDAQVPDVENNMMHLPSYSSNEPFPSNNQSTRVPRDSPKNEAMEQGPETGPETDSFAGAPSNANKIFLDHLQGVNGDASNSQALENTFKNLTEYNLEL